MLKKTWICKELYVTLAYGFREKGNVNERE